jgi:hypothetical protein
MSFALTKELEEYQAKIREYAQKTVREYAKYMDEANDGGDKIVKDLANMGLLGSEAAPGKFKGGFGS